MKSEIVRLKTLGATTRQTSMMDGIEVGKQSILSPSIKSGSKLSVNDVGGIVKPIDSNYKPS